MASPAPAKYRVDIKFTSARDLLNVNSWEGGSLRPYFCAWVEDGSKQCTYVADANTDRSYSWDRQILFIPFKTLDERTTLHIQCLHDVSPDDHRNTESSVGAGDINLHGLSALFGTVGRWNRSYCCKLKRSNGRPQGEVDMNISIRKLSPHVLAAEREYDGVEDI